MKNVFIIICIGFNLALLGQTQDTVKLPAQKSNFFTREASPVSFENKDKYGFSVGWGLSNFSIQEADIANSVFKDSITAVTSTKRQGASEVGLFVEHNVSPSLAYRIKFSFLFEAIQVNYHRPQSIEILKGAYASFNLPVNLILQTKGTNGRGYLLLGPSFSFGLGFDEEVLKSSFPNQFDIAIEAGIGYLKRFKMFFLGPELKFSQGLLNMNSKHDSIYNGTVNKLTRQYLILSVSISGA